MVTELWFKIGHIYSTIDPTAAVLSFWRIERFLFCCSVSDKRSERAKKILNGDGANLKIKRSAKSEFKFSFWSHVSRSHFEPRPYWSFALLLPQATKSPQANEMLIKVIHTCLSEH